MALDIGEKPAMEEHAHKEHHDDDFEQARQAADDEHRLTAMQAIHLHRNAVIWSVLLSTCIIMEGYDIVLMNSFFAQPAFSRKYGEYQPDTGTYQITASWQNGLSNAVSVGTMAGAFANGWFSHKMGYRPVLLASLASLCAFVFISFFAPNLPVLLVGQFLCGLPWGVFATMAPAYASEICPLALRGYLTVYVNLTWALGRTPRPFYICFRTDEFDQASSSPPVSSRSFLTAQTNGHIGFRLRSSGPGLSRSSSSSSSLLSRPGTTCALATSKWPRKWWLGSAHQPSATLPSKRWR